MPETSLQPDVASLARATHYHGEISFEIVEQAPDWVRASMEVAEGVQNPFGTVHAGALLWLADVTATVLALQGVAISAEGKGFPLAIDLNAQLIGSRRDGSLTAEAVCVRGGRRDGVIRTTVTEVDQRLPVDVTTTHMPA